MSVVVNSPKTPVTKGSNGIATATVPNVCKMPGPPAPFVPTPLPNIGRSSLSPKGYSKKVKIEGNPIAIKGATFASQGDIASKGTGGGIVSSNTHGPTKFVGPGALDVKVEGKSVQLLSDPMLNNCGPSGNPPNSATLMGVIQMTGLVLAVEAGECPVCKKGHDALEETEQSKADASALAGTFKGKLAPLRVRDGNEWVPVKVTTMLGVVHCKCGKKYADQSGVTLKEFCWSADKNGMKNAGSDISAKQDNWEAQNDVVEKIEERGEQLGAGARFARTLAKAARLSELSNEMRRRDKKKRKPIDAAYPPGSCAAQGALLLLVDDGALAKAMTEEYFSTNPEATMPARIAHKVKTSHEGPATHVRSEPNEFAVGDTVPPCASCVLILPMLLCTGGKTSCQHKKSKKK